MKDQAKKEEHPSKQAAVTTHDIAQHLAESIPNQPLKPKVEEIGEVIYIGDGVVKIKGLPSARIDDIIGIQTEKDEARVLVLGISQEYLEAVALTEYVNIKQGNIARNTGDLLRIKSGPNVLGRIIDPLGNPLDGLGPIKSDVFMAVEKVAPGVAKRRPVEEQLETGVLVVDTLIPIGKGQRELIIGNRKAGKSTLMSNFIINQKGRNMKCVYVAIGAQKAKVRAMEQKLRTAGALEYTTIVMASSDDPPSLNYIAPYAGCAIGEYFMEKGEDAFIIYDDLSKHAKAYRQMSLLLKRSPGRDAYPGDIFYLHSRLLERTCILHEKLGGGSLTGFPMAETQNGDVSEYIVTNLMSITDGHIYLDTNLMHDGVYPAVDSGTSVSRIGGGIQPPCLRKQGEFAGQMMARYNEVKSFETLNTEISEDTDRELKLGKRLLEIFTQDEKEALTNDEKTLLLHLVTSTRLNTIELRDVKKIKTEIIEFYRQGDFAFKKESLVAKNIEDIANLVEEIVEGYVKASTLPAAKFLIQPKAEEATPMPVIPDPAQLAKGTQPPSTTNADPKATTPPAEPTKPEEKNPGGK